MYSEGNPSRMEWSVCGEKVQKGLANDSFMNILVSLEGKK